MKDKKIDKKYIIIGIIILSVIIVGIIGVLVFKEVKDKDESDIKKEANQIPDVDGLATQDKEEIIKLVNKLEFFDFNGKTIISVNELSNQEKLQFARDYILNNTDKEDKDSISFEEMESIINEYLGESIQPENIVCSMSDGMPGLEGEQKYDYIYNNDKNEFVPNKVHPSHSGLINKVLNKVDTIDIENDIYKVVVYKAFENIRVEGDVYGYYPTYLDATMGINALFEKGEMSKEELFNDRSKLVKYTYTFIKNTNGKFILNSYIIGSEEE